MIRFGFGFEPPSDHEASPIGCARSRIEINLSGISDPKPPIRPRNQPNRMCMGKDCSQISLNGTPLGRIGSPCEHLGASSGSSREHLGGIWEASGSWGGPGRHLGAKCVQTPVFYRQKLRYRAFRVDATSSGGTITDSLR